jgi:S-DNA-T family DNA segregation ATPase FtsK/SpoIIIE
MTSANIDDNSSSTAPGGSTSPADRISNALPGLPSEAHHCPDCRISYQTITIEAALDAVASLPAAVVGAISLIPAAFHRQRAAPSTWSIVEYACHLRDVFATSTIRLYRSRTEVHPVLEPMFNDLRARRFGYNNLDLDAVLAELAANAAGFRDEAGRVKPPDWQRIVTRLSGEDRTARWLVRNAMHEGVHHLGDIVATGRSMAAAEQGS